jgi:hypothetical protein
MRKHVEHHEPPTLMPAPPPEPAPETLEPEPVAAPQSGMMKAPAGYKIYSLPIAVAVAPNGHKLYTSNGQDWFDESAYYAR